MYNHFLFIVNLVQSLGYKHALYSLFKNFNKFILNLLNLILNINIKYKYYMKFINFIYKIFITFNKLHLTYWFKSFSNFYKVLLHYYNNCNFCHSLDGLHESKFDTTSILN